jgi:rare lipoprotein A
VRRAAGALLGAMALSACAGRERPIAGYVRYDAVGLASWYGAGFAGRRTASGAPFDPQALTAAHRTLPLGTMASVTALATGRAVAVRITDRGPGRRDRLIDLSQGAARLLGVERGPPARVRVRSLPPGVRPGVLAHGRSVEDVGDAARAPAYGGADPP